MAVTNADILGWLNANPNADDALIVKLQNIYLKKSGKQ